MASYHLAPTGTRQHYSSDSHFEDVIGYSRAVAVEDWVFVSGTTGFDYKNGTISEDVVEQTEQAFKNIDAALIEAGSCLKDVVRVRYIVPNRDDLPRILPVFKHRFAETRPAATLQVTPLLKDEMKVEIEVTARRDSHKPKVY